VTDLLSLPADLRTAYVHDAYDTVRIVDALQDAGCDDPKVILLQLHRLILRDPDDDRVRLLWADWAERNGQRERAEFVRVQCELARLSEPDRCLHPERCYYAGECTDNAHGTISKRASELRCRERELWSKCEKWFPNLPGCYRTSSCGIRPEICTTEGILYVATRGFISELTCSLEDFQRHEPKLLWWPERKCERCGGSGERFIQLTTGYTGGPCVACHGEGEIAGATDDGAMDIGDIMIPTVPRCVSLTHQPITKVTLTTYPFQQANVIPGRTRDELEIETLRSRYPSVREWTLPQSRDG
jgi:uncharacterized protein (TIGR02996 family)